MKTNELKQNIFVRNIKHQTIEKVLYLGLMKVPGGEWINSVVYSGPERKSGEVEVFTKSVGEFVNEFDYMYDFTIWMTDVYNQLECHVSDEDKKNHPFNVFLYTDEDVLKNIQYFYDCFNVGMSAYKALTFFKI